MHKNEAFAVFSILNLQPLKGGIESWNARLNGRVNTSQLTLKIPRMPVNTCDVLCLQTVTVNLVLWEELLRPQRVVAGRQSLPDALNRAFKSLIMSWSGQIRGANTFFGYYSRGITCMAEEQFFLIMQNTS